MKLVITLWLYMFVTVVSHHHEYFHSIGVKDFA
jgi:hypothetical protein